MSNPQNITNIMNKATLFSAMLAAALPATAQKVTHMQMYDRGTYWSFPYMSDSIGTFTVSDDERQLELNMRSGAVVPFNVETLSTMSFANDPEEESKDHYKVFQMYITTEDGETVDSKEDYVPCYISMNAMGSFSNFSVPGQIRGRGNSSWLWYDKKPYRIKLDKKRKVLGLGKAKSWVLLANYRDVTDLMNTFVFETGQWLGLPFTNHTRYVETWLNGKYIGLYQLTEQVQQGSNRVNIDDDRGLLLTLDVDDGPANSPEATDNFWSSVFRMPVAVKYPKDEALTSAVKDSIQGVLAELETAIQNKDYELAASMLDMKSMADYLILQELVENVELVAPRSVFLYKDGDGKWTMGPLWDFDAGYDFDWSNMTTGHTYFKDYKELVLGSNPVKRNGYDHNIPAFFTNLFGCKEFVELYKQEWRSHRDSIVAHGWAECEKYLENLRGGAMSRDLEQWPIRGKDFETEVTAMHYWLINRASYLDGIVDNIPVPDGGVVVVDSTVAGTVSVSVDMDWGSGYHQNEQIEVPKARVCELLGIGEDDFSDNLATIVPLNTDGTEGTNQTNGVYGGWFDANGNPGPYSQGHVYIEIFDDLWNWNCGLYQDNCWDESHTVTMQIQYPVEGVVKKVNVAVAMSIDFGWW